jgi:large subunit ribosomal protein L18
MIDRTKQKNLARVRRHRRIRAKVMGTADRPRLAVFRSAKHIYAQIIDDAAGRTMVAAEDIGLDKKEAGKPTKGEDSRKAKVAVAYAVGKTIAEKAVKKGIKKVVFDRGGFSYTGRIAALASGARENGLEF